MLQWGMGRLVRVSLNGLFISKCTFKCASLRMA